MSFLLSNCPSYVEGMSVESTVSVLQSFPGPCSIPPACFYNNQGLAGWLNNNPAYKENFAFESIFYFDRIPVLVPSSFVWPELSSLGYKAVNAPLCTNVTTLSQYQAQKYQTQLRLFQKVYTINSNAYVSSITTGFAPIYYNFSTNSERSDYNSAVALVNKMYPFKQMSNAPGVNWQVPFPILY